MSTFNAPLRVGVNGTSTSGWVLTAQTANVVYGDNGTALTMSLPRPYHIIDFQTDVLTPFNDTGTDLLAIGVTGTTDAFAAALDLSAAGRVLASSDASQLANYVDLTVGAPIDVVLTYTGANSDASAGSARVTMLYMTPITPTS